MMVAGSVEAGEYYARAGIGVSHPYEASFTDTDCSSESPAALYGCGLGGDGKPYRSHGAFETVSALEVGLGRVGSTVRLEVLVDYSPGFEFAGHANFLEPGRRQSVVAEASSLSAMVAASVDVPSNVLPRFGSWQVFVGAATGMARNRIGRTVMNFPATTTIVPGGKWNGLSWMVMAGVERGLSDRTTLELSWRFSDLGEVHTGRGQGRVIWRDGSREPLLLDLAQTQTDLRGHGIQVALRYAR